MDKLLSGSPEPEMDSQFRNSRHGTSVDGKLVSLLEDIESENDIKFILYDIQQNLAQLAEITE